MNLSMSAVNEEVEGDKQTVIGCKQLGHWLIKTVWCADAARIVWDCCIESMGVSNIQEGKINLWFSLPLNFLGVYETRAFASS